MFYILFFNQRYDFDHKCTEKIVDIEIEWKIQYSLVVNTVREKINKMRNITEFTQSGGSLKT